MMRKRVLFVCIHNSARSQMAEAFLNHTCSQEFEASSAGLEPTTINPLVVEVMREVGIDLSAKKTQDVWTLAKRGSLFAFVISVCDEAAERCPIFPGVCKRDAWSFADPSTFAGTHAEKLEQTRLVRDQIRREVERFCEAQCARLPGRAARA
jgi:arsenate reductase